MKQVIQSHTIKSVYNSKNSVDLQGQESKISQSLKQFTFSQ